MDAHLARPQFYAQSRWTGCLFSIGELSRASVNDNFVADWNYVVTKRPTHQRLWPNVLFSVVLYDLKLAPWRPCVNQFERRASSDAFVTSEPFQPFRLSVSRKRARDRIFRTPSKTNGQSYGWFDCWPLSRWRCLLYWSQNQGARRIRTIEEPRWNPALTVSILLLVNILFRTLKRQTVSTSNLF